MIKIEVATTGPISVNTYLVYDETKKAFMVDPGGKSDFLLDKIKEENLDLEYIILTHGHGDHIGGIDDLRVLFPKVKVVALDKEKEMLEDEKINESYMVLRRAVTVKCDIFVKDEDILKVGNMILKFIATPGHTKGGMCILVEDILFSGDTLFHASIGRTDFYGGNYDEIVRSIKEKLFILPDETKVLPGHMSSTTIGYEKRNNPFV